MTLTHDLAEYRPNSPCAAPSIAAGGGREETAPATPREASALARLKQSIWAPVVLKAGAIALGMFVLAGIGVASTWASPGGAPVSQALFPKPAGSAEQPSHDHGSSTHPPPSAAPQASGANPSDSARTSAPATPIILNTASAEELTKLPGIGVKRARAIVELRERLHGFKRISDLLRVRGIGPRGLKRMQPFLVLDPPAQAAAPGTPDAGAPNAK